MLCLEEMGYIYRYTAIQGISMSKASERVKLWRIATKQKMIIAMGGKCVCCSYDKCNSALEFHHVNPIEKLFDFGRVIAQPIKWPEIIKELRKCVLVCCRCHREIEAGIRNVPENYTRFNEEYAIIENSVKISIKCEHCFKEFFSKSIKQRFCSLDCAAIARQKVQRPNKTELKRLLKLYSKRQIAEQFGVAGPTIGKWAKRYNLCGVA